MTKSPIKLSRVDLRARLFAACFFNPKKRCSEGLFDLIFLAMAKNIKKSYKISDR